MKFKNWCKTFARMKPRWKKHPKRKERYEREGVISHLGVPGEAHYRQFHQQ
jgi:hypothetical protein